MYWMVFLQTQVMCRNYSMTSFVNDPHICDVIHSGGYGGSKVCNVCINVTQDKNDQSEQPSEPFQLTCSVT